MITGQQLTRVVAAIVERDGKVFAARRNPDRSAGGLWEFPGGKIEPGESPEEALHRELQEELSIDATIGALVDRSSTIVTEGEIEMCCYSVEFAGSDPESSTDHDDLRWVNLSQLATLSWAPADIPIIERLPQRLAAMRPQVSYFGER